MIATQSRFVWCAVLGFLVSGAPAACDAGPMAHIRMPGPPLQDLMLGTWSIEVTHEPGPGFPQRRVTHGQEIWRIGPGGRSLMEEYDEYDPTGPIHEFGIAWWDPVEKGQKILWCGDYQPSGCALAPGVARWEGSSLTQTVEADESGKHVVRQEIFTDITAMSFTQVLKEGPSLAELKTTTTIHAMKGSSEARAARRSRRSNQAAPAR
jgi:hypothetical protein